MANPFKDALRATWRQRVAKQRWKEGEGPKETVEQYLARGGTVEVCAPVYLVPSSTVMRPTRAQR